MSRVALVGGGIAERDLVRSWMSRSSLGSRVASVTSSATVGEVPQDVEVAVVLLGDLGGGSLELERQQRPSPLSLIAVLTQPHDHVLALACGAGVGAVMAVQSGPSGLRQCLDAVDAGRRWLDPALSHLAMDQVGLHRRSARPFGLTPQEHRVASRLPRGLTYREIGHELGVTEETVKTHVAHVLRKLGVGDRAAAAAMLLKGGVS